MKKQNIYATTIALIVSIGGLLLGISATIGGANEYYRSYFDVPIGSIWEGLGVSAAMIGTLLGNFVAGSIGDRLGRKKGLVLAAFLFSFLCLGSSLVNTFTLFIITRFIGGFGIGISLIIAPLYIAEFAPPKRRGFLVSFNQLNIGIGFLLAYISNTIVDGIFDDPEMKWRWMLGVGFIFPVIYIISLLFTPESPRWLIQKGNDEKAKKIMRKAGGEEHAETEYAQIKENFAADQKSDELSYGKQWSILLSKKMRLVMLIAISIGIFQMVSGINVVFFFGPRVFNLSGANNFLGPHLQATIIGITMVVMTIVSMFIIDKYGRKPLLYIGVTLVAFFSIVAGLSFKSATYKIETNDITKIYNILRDDGKIAEATVYKNVLGRMENIEFNSEVKFFHTFKNKLSDAVKIEVNKSIDSAIHKNCAFGEEIKKNKDSNLSSEELIDAITSSEYSNMKGTILDESISINSLMVLIALVGIVIGFAISLGPIMWAFFSEIFPSKIRGLGISIAGTINGLTSLIVTTIFPIEIEYLGSDITYFIYAGFMILCLLMVWKVYPETKGKTLEQIEKELVKSS